MLSSLPDTHFSTSFANPVLYTFRTSGVLAIELNIIRPPDSKKRKVTPAGLRNYDNSTSTGHSVPCL